MTQISLQKKSRVKTGVLVFFGVLVFVYLAGAVYFHYHFFPNTTLNGVDVSGKKSGAAESAIRKQVDTYVLHMTTRNASGEEEITGESIGLKPEFHGEVQKHIDSQNVFAWVVRLFGKQKLKMDTVVVFDEDALAREMKALSCMEKKNQEEPKNAYISDYGENGYEIVPQEQGSVVDQSIFQMALTDAVKTLQKDFDLEENGCYKQPDVTIIFILFICTKWVVVAYKVF